MFSEKTFSIIKSIQVFGENRKGVVRVYYPDGEYEEISAERIKEMQFIDFAKIAVRLDGLQPMVQPNDLAKPLKVNRDDRI